MPTHGFGWRPDRPDDRDYLLHEHVRLPAAATLHELVAWLKDWLARHGL